MGQFDGSEIPKTLTLNMTGTDTVKAPGGTETVGDTITFEGALLTASGSSADLSITGSASPTPVATGKTITYSLTVANAGPDDATGTLVVNPTPQGTSIVSATSSQGVCSATPGGANCSLGTVPKDGTATITIVANVFAPAGFTLVDNPSVSSDIFDPNLANNSTTISTAVVGGAVVKLTWSQQQSTGGSSTAAPTGLQVEPAGPLSPSSGMASEAPAASDGGSTGGSPSRSAGSVPMDSCTQMGVNVYKSDQPGVQPIPANMFSSLAAGALEATVAVSPSGSSYVVSNLWKCGTSVIESGTSNELDVPAGPTITGLKITGKLKVLGSGFSGQVEVFVDGIGFVKAATLADSTLVIQKGNLSDGSSIADIGTSKSVLITVKNVDGGFATVIFKRP
jgi:uncharacterized repeat protein (TIGR01451 family)